MSLVNSARLSQPDLLQFSRHSSTCYRAPLGQLGAVGSLPIT
jgi:hypothetical protein